jgi:hypothetical protein
MNLVGQAFRFIAGAVVAIFVLTAVDARPAHAQQPLTVSQFLANPGQLLQQYPVGGTLMIGAVQQLALADPSTFKALIGLVANANDQQKSAIGEALTQAAKIEVLTNQTLAADWQQQIAAITDPAFKVAATNALGDVQLGSIGGGNLGSAGGGPAGPGGGGGPPQNIQSNTTNTQGFVFTGSTSGGPGVSVSP